MQDAVLERLLVVDYMASLHLDLKFANFRGKVWLQSRNLLKKVEPLTTYS
jgi:hypothetical protein